MKLSLEQGIIGVLEFMMTELRDSCDIIEYTAEYFNDSEQVPELNRLDEADYKKISNYSVKTWQKKFKERFGFTDEQYYDQYQKMIRASLTEGERVLIEYVEHHSTANLSFGADGKVGGAFYYSTPTKVAYEPFTWTTGVYIHASKAEEYGMKDMADIVDFLMRIGAVKKSRPKQSRRYNTSLYD